MLRLATLALAVSLFSVPALADDDDTTWKFRFDSKTLVESFPGWDLRVLVASAGDAKEPMARRASRALKKRIGELDAVAVVQGEDVLGRSLEGMSDVDIVALAEPLKPAFVAVIRTTPGGEGFPPVASVSVYRLDGEVLKAFTVEGTRSKKKKKARRLDTADAPTEAGPSHYDLNYIWFDEGTVVQGSQYGIWTSRVVTPVKGIYRQVLTGKLFYEEIGDEALIAAYNGNLTRNMFLVLGGGVLTAASVPVMLVPVFVGNLELFPLALMGGLIVGTAGTTLLTFGLLLSPHPIDESEMRRRADQHNRTLKRLGRRGLPNERRRVAVALSRTLHPALHSDVE
jgi:hypothetical protein